MKMRSDNDIEDQIQKLESLKGKVDKSTQDGLDKQVQVLQQKMTSEMIYSQGWNQLEVDRANAASQWLLGALEPLNPDLQSLLPPEEPKPKSSQPSKGAPTPSPKAGSKST